jgi:hypothetical protein
VTRSWARLTWQAPGDPAELAGDLAHRLGVVAEAAAGGGGELVVDLGTAPLFLVPWRREGPMDDPVAGGRLVLEPEPGGAIEAGTREPGVGRVVLFLGIAWATVELDRAEVELEDWLGSVTPGNDAAAALDEPHLGARARVRPSDGLPGAWVVLIEPSTEGPTSAALARHGEGPAALYLAAVHGLAAWSSAARGRGATLSPVADGPLGRSVRVSGGSFTGPQLIVVDTGTVPIGAEPPGTIGA